MFVLRRVANSSITNGQKLIRTQNKHTLPALPYAYNALEPVICAEIMELHHKKHHQAYVNGLNDAEEKVKEAVNKSDFPTLIKLADAVRFNGGGHINHTLFWDNMSAKGGNPSKQLSEAICKTFGSFDEFKNQMSQLAVGVQGSGWAWLGFNPTSKTLQLAKCPNQDPLQPTTGLVPLLGIDVWEHAYYIQYKNVRADYVKKFWDVVNWNCVSERFAKAC